ncbi:Gp138 family membrane-puncturing spike protein [Kosakonia sacchari]|uniref:Gp138 family membrane-puncturing spike protein n=1 Tax=Kosakonia sacchari TaxID=1158459 RepID=UPI002ACEBAD8|nr:Gp138 family membrane-puncturing spike protein [Kosakonia sacchari]MDZ7320761.1 Gp138 family membrane-puncturing spike protein [Kosakonia sacchari]
MAEPNTFLTLLSNLRQNLLWDMMIGMPGKVISYDPDIQRAVVECGIQRHEGGGQFETLPEISHVPVQFAGSANWSVFHELPEGTEGYIHFSQRSVDYWLNQGGPVKPFDARMFDANDAFFAPGYRSRATSISGLPTEGIGMSNASGTVRLHLSDGGINLKVGSQTLSLSSDGLTHNGKNIGSTHKHGGVEKGGSKTGDPE